MKYSLNQVYILKNKNLGGINIFQNELIKALSKDYDFVIVESVAAYIWMGLFNRNGVFLLENQYLFFSFLFRKKIGFLHGWVDRSGGYKHQIWRVMNYFARWSNTEICTCSYISKNLNEVIFGHNEIKVIHHYLESNTVMGFNSIEKNIDYIYVGRFSKQKKIESILNNFELLSNLGFKCVVVGFSAPNEYSNSKIDFKGEFSSQQVHSILLQSKVFVSLNPLEPFGISYVEAYNSGCKILCPSNSGFSELKLDLDYVDDASIEEYIECQKEDERSINRYKLVFNRGGWLKVFKLSFGEKI
jgi:glycosyltransferase involved in cell wall biosynthesis